MREGTRKEVIDLGLAAAAAKLATMPVCVFFFLSLFWISSMNLDAYEESISSK